MWYVWFVDRSIAMNARKTINGNISGLGIVKWLYVGIAVLI